jgi:uroporphyrin-3 C-methyltransferase
LPPRGTVALWCPHYNGPVTDDATAPLNTPPPLAVLPTVAPPPPPHAAPIHFSRLWVVGAVVFGALSVAGFVSAWHTQQRVRALEQQLVKRQQDSQDQATEARLLAKQALDGVREQGGKLGVLEDRVAESQLQRSQVEELMQALSRSRDENVLADVESALRVAMQQAALTGSTDPIATVLRQAEDRLARLNNPRLERVRRAVARDLDRVRSAAVVDVPSLTIRLDEAVRQVDELPLLSTPERATAIGRAAAVAAAARSAPAPRAASAPASAPHAGEPEWLASARRAWEGFSGPFLGELKQAVRVTSIEHPEAMLLTPDQSFFLRENVKLRLLNARLSLLSRQFDLAQADLQQAQAALERYFDRSSRRVVSVAEVLRQVSAQARQVSFPRPDETLAALSAAASGH